MLGDHAVRVRRRCSRPARGSARPDGSYATRQPMRRSRQQRSRSSMYMKYRSSHPPTESSALRRRNSSAPDTQSTSRGRSQRRVELAVAAGEPVARQHATEHRVADGVDGRGVRRADGYCEPSGLSSAGPTAARSGSASSRPTHRGRGARRHHEVGVADGHAPARASPRCPGWRRRRTRGCRRARRRRRRGTRRAASPTDPSREPLSTTTTSGCPALVVGEDRTHARRAATAPTRSSPPPLPSGGGRLARSTSVHEAVLDEGPRAR